LYYQLISSSSRTRQTRKHIENYPPLEKVENKALGCRDISLPDNILFLQDYRQTREAKELPSLREGREQGFRVQRYFITS
jgi:hypothetical protein